MEPCKPKTERKKRGENEFLGTGAELDGLDGRW